MAPLFALAAALALPAAHAEKADRNKPIHVEADRATVDDAKQIMTLTGNVVITQGTTVLRGDKVEVRQDKDGFKNGVVWGNLAYFKQKREGVNEFIEGEARRIEYDSRADTVRFVGDAVLRRYLGTELNDETRGSVIVYDNRSEVFTVDGNPGTANPGNPGEDGRGTFRQGYLENSSVDAVHEITGLIEAQRGYELNAKVITAADQMLAATVQTR